MKKVAIFGYGRFGKTLFRLLKDDFQIVVYDRHAVKKTPLSEIYSSDVIFYCVPIAVFEKVIKEHHKFFRNQLLIDVLSVKEYPKKIFKKYLRGKNTQALLTHPLFGPDSSKNGFAGLPLVMDKFLCNEENYLFWKSFFQKKGLRVIEISAQEHDRLAAKSQGLTHFIGRMLEEFDFQPTSIDTLGAKKLLELKNQTCNDTWELFLNLQNYNRYTKPMRLKLGKAYEKIYAKLLPERVDKKYWVFGIQGGKGSFNEEALHFYTQKAQIKNIKTKYLYTTEKVLRNLHEGKIDYGIFAIQNAVGGVVQESTYAMARYKFKIVAEFGIFIRHFLMKRKDVNLEKIKTIMAHPQVFRQCKSTLAKKYSKYKLISGKNDLVDTAKAAWALAKGKIAKNTAILGPKTLAKIYGLKIIAKNLQDDKNNITTFFVVKR